MLRPPCTALAERRRTCGFTQETLAELLGVARTTVTRWEIGAARPQPWARPKLARILGITTDQLAVLLAGVPSVSDGPTALVIAPPAGVETQDLRAADTVQNGTPIVVGGQPDMAIDEDTVAGSGCRIPPADSASGGEPSVQRPAVTATDWDEMSPLSRRSLLTSGAAVSAHAALGLGDPTRVASAMDDARRYLDDSVIDHFRRHLAACKADDGTLGPQQALPTVLGILGAVEEHAREVKPAIRRPLLTVGADCAEFAGWLCRDAGDTARALFWHDRATEWAQEAGDLPMQGYVLLRRAQLAPHFAHDAGWARSAEFC